MLVEDDNNLREIYGARLQAEGHEIVAAKDGEEALSLAVKEKPELIISDVMMPRISGFDMLDILRNAPETKNTKVIMMTALSQAEDKARADKLGADRYLVKSQVTLEDVAKVVRDVLEGDSETGEAKLEDITAASTAAPASDDSGVASPAAASPPPAEPAVAASDDATAAPQPAAAAVEPPKPAPASDPVASVAPAASAAPAQPDPQPAAAPVLPPPTTAAPDTPAAAPAAEPAAAPEIKPLKSPELAAAEALLTTPPEPAAAAPASPAEPAPASAAAAEPPKVVLPTPPDEVVAEPPAAPEPAAPEPAKEEEPPFVGPSLEQALAAEESNTGSTEPAAAVSAAPTIMNGIEQSGIITPAAQEPAKEEEIEETETAEDTSEVHAQPPTPLQQENAAHKKVISPINDPTKKFDINAAIAAEEQKAAVINPAAGTNIVPESQPEPLPQPAKDPSQHNDIAL